MTVSSNNLFEPLPDAGAEELFTTLLQGKSLRIERIVSKGQSSPESGWYDQREHEWVIVLKGEAKLVFERGEQFHLGVGDYLHIPAHARHRVSWTPADRETVWLAVHYW